MSNYPYPTIDLVEAGGLEYAPCGHDLCDLGVGSNGKVQCSGEYCADLTGWLPDDEIPVEAYWSSEEDYPL